MDTRLDKNEAELGVLVLSIPLKVFPHRDSLCEWSVGRYHSTRRIVSLPSGRDGIGPQGFRG